jgi:mycothiol system anti-sigma-R factor
MKEGCRRILERAVLLIDGEDISYEERIEIETHLHECGPCFERYGIDQQVKAIIVNLSLPTSTPCPDQLKTKITHLVDEL